MKATLNETKQYAMKQKRYDLFKIAVKQEFDPYYKIFHYSNPF